MDDEKITITMDEVKRATPVPGSTPPPFFAPGQVPDEPATGNRRISFKIGIAVAVLAILVVAGIGISAVVIARQTRTVVEYRIEAVRKYNEQLADPSSSLLANLRERVQSVDASLNMTSAEITKCEVETLDGSDSAGRKDRNIGEVTLGLRANWDRQGVAGHTDIEFAIDGQTRIVKNAKVVQSTPIGNQESTDGGDWTDGLIGEIVEGFVWGFFDALLYGM